MSQRFTHISLLSLVSRHCHDYANNRMLLHFHVIELLLEGLMLVIALTKGRGVLENFVTVINVEQKYKKFHTFLLLYIHIYIYICLCIHTLLLYTFAK